jgi:hypothetical protein
VLMTRSPWAASAGAARYSPFTSVTAASNPSSLGGVSQ